MEKTVLVKVVWLAAILAIPAVILAVQKPEVRMVAETRRVIAVDRPVSVEVAGRQIEAAKGAETASAAELPKPQAIRLGGEKITSKGGPSAEDSAARSQNLAAVLGPVQGPRP